MFKKDEELNLKAAKQKLKKAGNEIIIQLGEHLNYDEKKEVEEYEVIYELMTIFKKIMSMDESIALTKEFIKEIENSSKEYQCDPNKIKKEIIELKIQ